MITLKEARLRAGEIMGEAGEPPKETTLRDWIMKGYISRPAKYRNKGRAGGRVGLYNEALPVEIATIIAFKERYKLKQLKGIRNKAESMFASIGVDLFAVGPPSGASEEAKRKAVKDIFDHCEDHSEAVLLVEYLHTYVAYLRRYVQLQQAATSEPKAKAE